MDISNNKKNKVFVAMSGGVDSAVSAILLKKQGYDVTGVFMKNWSGDNFGIQTDCPWEKDQADAEKVCNQFDIPFRSFNFEKEYRSKVVEYFFDEIRRGRTPNPDVMCNKEIKFGIFLTKAMENGADMIATGHYAQINFDTQSNKFQLLKGVDSNKDQSYFLHRVTQEQLAHTLFPIGDKTKPEVRDLAAKFDIPVAKKPDSQGICFIGEINVAKFLRANINTHLGDIIDLDSKQVIGKHDGIEFYTIGQREGLNLGGASEPYFVASKDKMDNILYVAKGKNNPYLYRNEVKFSDFHSISGKYEDLQNKNIFAMIRYRQIPASCSVEFNNDIKSEGVAKFNLTQRAVAEGQNIVFYDGNECLGGGIIC